MRRRNELSCSILLLCETNARSIRFQRHHDCCGRMHIEQIKLYTDRPRRRLPSGEERLQLSGIRRAQENLWRICTCASTDSAGSASIEKEMRRPSPLLELRKRRAGPRICIRLYGMRGPAGCADCHCKIPGLGVCSMALRIGGRKPSSNCVSELLTQRSTGAFGITARL